MSPSQVITLQILLYLILVHKTVQTSKLSNYFTLPIKSESKRKYIQKILTVKELSLPLFWFPLVKKIIENLFSQFFEDKAIEKSLGTGINTEYLNDDKRCNVTT